MGRMTKCAHKPIVYDKLHGAKLDELIEYSNATETRIHALIRAVKNANPKSEWTRDHGIHVVKQQESCLPFFLISWRDPPPSQIQKLDL